MNIEGYTVTRVRPMTPREMNRKGWEVNANGPPIVLELKGPTKGAPKIRIYPSTDPEGNGPGDLFGYYVSGSEQFFVKPD